jgi:hypothetical protein
MDPGLITAATTPTAINLEKSSSRKQTQPGVELRCGDAEKETNPSASPTRDFGQEEGYFLLHRIRAPGHCCCGSH